MAKNEQAGEGGVEGRIAGWFDLLLRRANWQKKRASQTGSPGAGRTGETGGRHRGPGQLEWSRVIDAMPDPAILLDRDLIIVHFNPQVADVFPKVRKGQAIDHLTRSPALLEALANLFERRGRVAVEIEARVPVVRNWSAMAATIDRDGEPPLLALLVLRDLTEQQRHARQRTDFIAFASHEMRTPLASLRSMIETLIGPARDDPEARKRFLTLMAGQAERMTRLIDDLLSLGRAEMRVHLAPTTPVDVDAVVASVVDQLQPVARAAHVTLSHSAAPAPAIVRGDAEDLAQVFQNLIQNAIKYGRDGGVVRVLVEREPTAIGALDKVLITVADEGEGIAPEHLPRLTERFYRVSVANSRSKGGTGLGLAIVKYIVNRHRGELRIASKQGQGSRFTVAIDAISSKRHEG